MKRSNGALAVIVCLMGLTFPVFAQQQQTTNTPEAQQDNIVVQDETTEAPVRDFNNILDQTIGNIEDQQPILTDEQENDLEQELIDPDFLMDDVKAYDDYEKVTLRFLNKITSESETFDLTAGKTVAYGSLRLRPMACKKSPPIEEPESASFLQIWEKIPNADDEWVFSGWMFASSPSLSAMEHPVYDVWVVDCKS